MNPWKKLKASEIDGRRFVTGGFRVEPWLTEVLIDEAINRLENGDVSETQYGMRVQVRPDLGEYRRSGAAAFWPKDIDTAWPRCVCFAIRQYCLCSHVVAARLYREWLAGGMKSVLRQCDPQIDPHERDAEGSDAIRDADEEMNQRPSDSGRSHE